MFIIYNYIFTTYSQDIKHALLQLATKHDLVLKLRDIYVNINKADAVATVSVHVPQLDDKEQLEKVS